MHGLTRRHAAAAFPNGVGQGHQIVLVGMHRQWPGMAYQLPAPRRGDPSGMCHAQIPRVRLTNRGKRAHHCRRVRIHERQRRHGVVRAPGPAAATGNIHAREAIALAGPGWAGHAHPGPPLLNRYLGMPDRYDRPVAHSGSSRHRPSGGRWSTRHGRNIRGPLLPPDVPGWRSRAERFDMAVLEAYEPIERRFTDRVTALDVAVDEIPRIAARDPENVQFPPEVVADGPVALARLIPAGVDVRGQNTRARIVLFRKPIERRAKDTGELTELLHDILVAQVATYLGVEPSVIDPSLDEE